MQKTKIEWTDYTCNPIKGQCKGGCWYCWTKPLYKRKFLQPKIRLDLTVFDRLPKKPQKIFLCSTHDLFGDWIPKGWRNTIFVEIKNRPRHTFQILTKFPQNIDRPMPDNVWLGVSITEPKEMAPRIKNLYQARAKLRFISFEPLLGDVGQFQFQGWLNEKADWIIVGRLTGYGHKQDPKTCWIESIINHAKKFNTPIFLKDNLKEIWGDSLIQEFP